jgi:hypothetical protein
MKMHDYEGWRIGIDLDTDANGSSRALVSVFEPGTGGPRTYTGHGLGQAFNGSSPEEAERKAVEAARKWIDGQLPHKRPSDR